MFSAACNVCDAPASHWVNVSATAASTVPSVFEPRCDDHAHFKPPASPRGAAVAATEAPERLEAQDEKAPSR